MKSKLITTMVTALFLTFAIIAPPLLSVPTVSARTLRFEVILWGLENPYYTPNGYPLPIDPEGHPQTEPPLWEGPLAGDISGTMYTWTTDLTHFNPNNKVTILHWYQDFLIVFDDGGWIIGWWRGIYNVKSGLVTCEGRITSASYPTTDYPTWTDKQSFVGCKISGKGILTEYSTDLNVPSWGLAWGEMAATGQISGNP